MLRLFFSASCSTSTAPVQASWSAIWRLSALALIGLLLLGGCRPSNSSSVDPALKRFAQAKKVRARAWVEEQKLTMPPEAWTLFDATIEGRWEDATNAYAALPGMRWSGATLRKRSLLQVLQDQVKGVLAKFGYKQKIPTALQSEVRATLNETYGALEQFQAWDNRLLHFYGETIIGSIPTNSIYFGGTDSGRYIISALCDSQEEGRPFFTLTQNALADVTYIAYVRKLYGSKLAIPSQDDSQRAFTTYLVDAQRRLAEGRLKPGESVTQSAGRVSVGGQISVMEINGLLARDIFDKNPDREVYLEESWPLDWMYPYLSPHGPLLQLQRQPLSELSEAVVLQDRDYWKRLATQLIGDSLPDDASFAATCDFVRRIYLTKDLNGFKGDSRYVRNAAAQQGFSALRKAIAGVYAWRADQAKTPEERARMRREAERAYRQAFALGPGNSDTAERYANLLISEDHKSEAITLLQMSVAADPSNPRVVALLKVLTQK